MPTIFNVTVNSAVLHWLLLMLKDEAVIRDGLGHAVGRILGVLYADYGLLVSLNPEWLHGSLKVLIGLFHWIRLATNVAKLKMMMYHLE